ncbi:hypothetical protein CAEBREN_04860 [Caenorhabditis brenneri]|uniref:Uncharacterized protein n=1 Tax=Caenorhabditis brenneri TaxID=135651 RepID=G0PFG8_CAEBE|nr:hypothetical protein CAEBREN_04860 [Caenorhabditis brenneri]
MTGKKFILRIEKCRFNLIFS